VDAADALVEFDAVVVVVVEVLEPLLPPEHAATAAARPAVVAPTSEATRVRFQWA
jgi:hypothetical protein